MADRSLVEQVADQLGWPAILVERSAEARATAEGVSADDVLRAWASGGAVESGAAPAEPEEPEAASAEEPAAEEPAPEEAPPPQRPKEPEEEPEEAVPEPEPQPLPAADRPRRVSVAPPPLKEPGAMDSPLLVASGSVGLFLLGLVFAFLLPVLEGHRPTELALSWRNYPAFSAGQAGADMAQAGLDPSQVARGRGVYLREGCTYCHTQAVRPIVTDADLGPVTRPGDLVFEEPDVTGLMRIGPDLMHAGARGDAGDPAWVAAHLRDPRAERPWSLMPSYAYLSEEDLAALAHYVAALRGGEEAPPPEGEEPQEETPPAEEGEGDGEG